MPVKVFMIAVLSGMLLASGVHADDINPVVGKVGDFVLREADLERMIANLPAEAQKRFQENREERSNLARQILLTKAVAAKAKSEGFDRKPDVKERLSNIIDQYLAEEYIAKVVIANLTPPEAELKKYYQEHEKDFLLPERVKARHIFVKAAREEPAEAREKARSKAEGILQRIKKGEDFSVLARELSDDEDTAANGGSIGYISPGKTNAEEFEKALFALKSGETSGVVETPFGYHIIRIDERQEKRTATFDEASEYIRNRVKVELEQSRTREFIDKLAKDAGLELVVDKSTGKGENEKAPVKH